MKCPHCKIGETFVAGTAGKDIGNILACGCGWRGYDEETRKRVEKLLQGVKDVSKID